MLTIEQTEDKLRDKVEMLKKKPGKGSSGALDFLKAESIALAMNEAFGPTGWDTSLDEIKLLKEPYRVNKQNGPEDPNGGYWNAIAYAVVTVKARALFRQDGTYVEASRQDVSVASAVGGKATTPFDAIEGAMASAATKAFKRACRFFGPK